MFADQLKKKYQKNLIILALIVILTTMIFMVILLSIPAYFKIGIYILVGILFLMIAYFIHKINRDNKKVYQLKFRISSLDYKVPYPSSFKKQQRTLLIDGKKGYTINKKVIPARFIEFVEGKRAYIIKELDDINEINEYRILFIHQHTYALIEDVEHKKWIIHMNCLEQLTT